MSNEKMGYAPYALIPLAPKVVLPDWQDQVSHSTAQPDDSYDGVINVTLKASTEIFTANQHEKDEKGALSFSKNPDGKYYIAGSSIRGMLRNVLEVASYGKSMFVDNHVVATRTIDDQHYKDAFTYNEKTPDTGQKPVSGWLKYNSKEAQWEFRSCKMLNLPYGQMKKLKRNNSPIPEKGESAISKYKKYSLNTEVFAQEDPQKNWTVDSESIGRGKGQESWHPVFLGHMTGKKDKNGKSTDKKGDYLFKRSGLGEPLVVSATVFQSFKQAHSNDESHLDYLLKNPSTLGIPVFARLTKEHSDEYGKKHPKEVALISLAKLPRLTAKIGPKDLLDKQKKNNKSKKLDFPELLFGRVFEDKKNLKGIEKGLKHRISAADFILSSGHEVGAAKTHLLGSPAASFTPAFLDPSAKHKSQSGSYLDESAKLIGFTKRYFNHTRSAANSSGKWTQLTTFYPMPKGSEFTGSITFKNLNKKELGALLWAISLGENKDNHHQIGMAKPYGYGSVQLNVNSLKLRALSNNPTTEQGKLPSSAQVFKQLSPQSLQANTDEYRTFIEAFQDYIIEQVDDKEDDFNELPTIKSLQVMLKQYDNVPGYMPLSLTRYQRQQKLKIVTYANSRKNNQGRIQLPLEAAKSLKRSAVKEE